MAVQGPNFLVTTVTTFIVIIFITSPLISACLFGAANGGCFFNCNCNNTYEICDPNTGACPNSGCRQGQPRPDGREGEFDWRGPGCQIGNVALKKTTDQSGVYRGMVSSRAVDGLLGDNNNDNYDCAHPENTNNVSAWWWVDLEEDHVIYNVTVFNTKDAYGSMRMEEFVIGVGSESDVSSHSECGFYGSPKVASGGHVTVLCGSQTTGRYVSFKRTGGFQIHLVTICEVVVMGSRKLQPGIPDKPVSNVTAVALSSTSVRVGWKQYDFPEELEEYYIYRVAYAQHGADNKVFKESLDVPHNVRQTYQSTEITGLTSGVEYDFKVRPYRQMGGERERGYASGRVSARTNDTASTGAPPRSTTTTSTSTSSTTTPRLSIIPGNSLNPGSQSTITTTIGTHTNTAESAGTQGSNGPDTDNKLPLIVGVVVGAVLVLALVIVAVIFVIRRRKPGGGRLLPTIKKNNPKKKGKLKADDVKVMWTGNRDGGHENGGFVSQVNTDPAVVIKPEPEEESSSIPVADLPAFVSRHKNIPDGFKDEYQKLPKDNYAKCDAGSKQENKSKNRFANIKPFDATRVVLQIEEGSQATSDYINGNYIMGYKEVDNHYIATQGPRPQTKNDFWRLVWQEGANRIVMVTRLVEHGRKKCECYWGDKVGSSMTYDLVTVTTVAEQEYADYAYRMFKVTKGDEERNVHQLHFLSWVDKSRPEHAFPLLAFLRRVRALDKQSRGPMVVHCSAGVGRTGTFMALDYLQEQARVEGQVDVFNCVRQLRTQRMSLVQLLEQYKFVYEALLESIECGDTAVACSQFEDHFAKLCDEGPDGTTLSGLEMQYEMLRKYKSTVTLKENASGLQEENQGKNRNNNLIPNDVGRPHLNMKHEGHNDYINAVFVDGYKAQNAFILTQMPLPSTTIDMWRLVHDPNRQHCNTIVMLNQVDKDDPSCAVYWPEEDEPKQKYGPLEVQLIRTDAVENPNIIIRDFQIVPLKKATDPPLTVRQFQLMTWNKDDALPGHIGSLLELMELVTRWQQQTEVTPVVVHCMDGCERSGLYAAASYMLDMMKEVQEVDVFLATRYVTSKWPHAITSLEQYRFLHELAIACMSNFDTYANFK